MRSTLQARALSDLPASPSALGRENGRQLRARVVLRSRAAVSGARVADNAMVALALLVAESEPKQKDLMIRLIVNLLEDGAAPRG